MNVEWAWGADRSRASNEGGESFQRAEFVGHGHRKGGKRDFSLEDDGTHEKLSGLFKDCNHEHNCGMPGDGAGKPEHFGMHEHGGDRFEKLIERLETENPSVAEELKQLADLPESERREKVRDILLNNNITFGRRREKEEEFVAPGLVLNQVV